MRRRFFLQSLSGEILHGSGVFTLSVVRNARARIWPEVVGFLCYQDQHRNLILAGPKGHDL